MGDPTQYRGARPLPPTAEKAFQIHGTWSYDGSLIYYHGVVGPLKNYLTILERAHRLEKLFGKKISSFPVQPSVDRRSLAVLLMGW